MTLASPLVPAVPCRSNPGHRAGAGWPASGGAPGPAHALPQIQRFLVLPERVPHLPGEPVPPALPAGGAPLSCTAFPRPGAWLGRDCQPQPSRPSLAPPSHPFLLPHLPAVSRTVIPTPSLAGLWPQSLNPKLMGAMYWQHHWDAGAPVPGCVIRGAKAESRLDPIATWKCSEVMETQESACRTFYRPHLGQSEVQCK